MPPNIPAPGTLGAFIGSRWSDLTWAKPEPWKTRNWLLLCKVTIPLNAPDILDALVRRRPYWATLEAAQLLEVFFFLK